ncbi:MAG: hypothetical protein ABI542_00255 [Gemmatimonadota bacterium]
MIRNDSLIGERVDLGGRQIGIPTMSITTVKTRQFNAGGTILMGVLALGIVGMVALASEDSFGYSGGGLLGDSNGNVSCPLIYSWDGRGYRLDSGTFGGAITPALARTDLDNLLHVRPVHDTLRFLMTDEADETEHVDAFHVLAVDHPVGTEAVPDALANGTFHLVGQPVAPITARDQLGRDALQQVRAADQYAWESRLDGRDPENPAHLRDGLEMTFRRPAGMDQAELVVEGQNTAWAAYLMGELVRASGRATRAWYDTSTSAAASRPMAKAQHEEGFLQASIWDGAAWRPAGEMWEAGPEVAKRQTLRLDLRGTPVGIVRVRLESAPAMWNIDQVVLAAVTGAPAIARILSPVTASIPTVRDALAPLLAKDGRYLDLERGDTVRIAFTDAAPPPARGMVRSYLAQTSGWYRVHSQDDAAPDLATLGEMASHRHGAARVAVRRLNERLAAMTREAGRANLR